VTFYTTFSWVFSCLPFNPLVLAHHRIFFKQRNINSKVTKSMNFITEESPFTMLIRSIHNKNDLSLQKKPSEVINTSSDQIVRKKKCSQFIKINLFF